MRRLRLAVPLGDPCGIGPEVVAKALRDPAIKRLADFRLYGNSRPGKGMRLGKPSAAGGRAAFSALGQAAMAVLAGGADALVTAPLAKEALHLAGLPYAGQTEILAEMAGIKGDDVGMLLVGGKLRVFLVTRHMSLRQALARLSVERICRAARLCGEGLKFTLGIARPRLALAALNPHAGEAGAFGDEEKRVLGPALKALAREKSFKVSGPSPADTVFVQAVAGSYDAVLCLYHDQGLIPLKLHAFDSGVNITLGLPFVRTSPDHGTAFDIAGKGKASPESMKEAIRLAVQYARRRLA